MWPASSAELIAIQETLAAARPPPWRPAGERTAIGAVVVVFPRGQGGVGARGDPAWVAATVMRGGRVLASAVVASRAGAGYEPGLLALREGPCLEAAVRALDVSPDVLLVDATGRDHPRRAGLALHLGAVLELPTIGVTHRPLLAAGEWPQEVRGASAPLLLGGETVAAWLRTRRGARPLAIHPAWRTEIGLALELVTAATGRYRTPEPLRRGRMLARRARASG